MEMEGKWKESRGMEGGGGLRVEAGFYRGHGLGNDYLVLQEAGEGSEAGPAGFHLTEAAVQTLCHRWTGIGGDGVVVLLRGRDQEDGGFRLRMFNPDGSEFERSGNGLRILASWLYRTGQVDREPFRVRSGGEEMEMQVHGVDRAGEYDVSVQMGQAQVGPEPVRVGPVEVTPVRVGNPHVVLFTEDLSREHLERVGPFLARHRRFPGGVNVQLASRTGPGRLRIAIWERGVGPTAASGTSSCAAAVAAVHRGLLEAGALRVDMEGGRLQVTVSPELEVQLRGPVREICTGTLAPGFLRSLDGDVRSGPGSGG